MKSSTSPEFEIYVTDTVALIWYFAEVFGQVSGLSRLATSIFDQAIASENPFVRLIIPSVALVEIYDKWFKTEEFARRFYYEVYLSLQRSENVTIRNLDQEILHRLLEIGGSLDKHEIHDKLILASAMALNCPLITSDGQIEEYVKTTGVIPSTVR